MAGHFQDIIGNAVMFLAIAISARKTPRRSLFWLRIIISFAVFTALRYVYFNYLGPLIPRDSRHYVQIGGFVTFIPLLALSAFSCWELDRWSAVYCGSSAYCVQHIINKVYDIVRRMFFPDAGDITVITVLAVIALAFTALYWFLIRRQGIDRVSIDSKVLLLLAMLVILTAVILDMRLIDVTWGAPPEAYYYIRLYSITAAVINLGFHISLVSSKSREQELNTVRAIVAGQEEQYRFEKSIIDTMNVKLHDLKHQLADLDEKDKKRLSREFTPVIEAYDSRFRTENPALDVLLTRKGFTCREKGIHLTVMADGRALGFMSETDVYSLFGNILDNAIEAAEKLEDPDKKVIKLSVEKNGFFVSIHEENYNAQKLSFEDGLPQTTKKDSQNHGFGMKSIRMLAERYDGSLKILAEDDRFVIDILFPV